MKVLITRLDKELPIPHYKHDGDAGMDIYSREDVVLEPGQFKMVPTGLKIAVPFGYEVQVRPRSGLAAKHGISIVNTPGTVDCGYRGEIAAILINHGKEAFHVKRAERIAQIVINKVEIVEVEESEILPDSTRGEGGFGSTGRK
ncbi:dUTP diphosphatase [Candidatus Woesearchaeota archaeon]|nr:dUTP diphosphatase [Candidatus Woesearchaeota archaeon]